MIKFIHIRTGLKGGTTIGYSFDGVGNRVVYAVAKCNANENYNKKIGRAVTTGRLNKGRGQIVNIPEGEKITDFIIAHAGI